MNKITFDLSVLKPLLIFVFGQVQNPPLKMPAKYYAKLFKKLSLKKRFKVCRTNSLNFRNLWKTFLFKKYVKIVVSNLSEVLFK